MQIQPLLSVQFTKTSIIAQPSWLSLVAVARRPRNYSILASGKRPVFIESGLIIRRFEE